MVKFIIEVSEGYIRERADIANILSNCENSARGMFDLISFTAIKKDIENSEGNVEYTLKSDDFADDVKQLDMFNSAVSICAGISCVKILSEKTNNTK